MRILVLDDDPERHSHFASNLTSHQVVHVDTYDKVCDQLARSERFDLVYLDHDLNDHQARSVGGPTMYGGPRELDGRDVATFIAKKLPKDKRPKKVIVHSWNQTGAAQMVAVLQKAGLPVRYEMWHPHMGG